MRGAQSFWRRFSRSPPAVFGLAIVVGVSFIALAAPILSPGDPWAVTGAPSLWPGADAAFPLGTDLLGRDLLKALTHGAQVSLLIGLSAALIAGATGVLVGAAAGYFGGLVDDAFMRIAEVFQTIPAFLLAIVIVALFGPSLVTVVGAIAAVSWPGMARIVRAETLRLRNQDFVAACAVYGMGHARIIVTQILPNALAPIIVMLSAEIASAILIEAGLSFLGLGDPSQMSWGTIISMNKEALRSAWYTITLPGAAILVTVMGVSLVGDGLNDALNPHLRERPA